MSGKLLLPALLAVSLGIGYWIGGVGHRDAARAQQRQVAAQTCAR